MGRRSDHSRDELRSLIIDAGHQLMAETGYARFSAREVAKRIGYSVGTIYNVVGDVDRLILAINARTFAAWAAAARAALEGRPDDPIAVLVESYFAFAQANPHLWMAIYDHRVPNQALPDDYVAARRELMGLVEAEIARALPAHRRPEAGKLTPSLLATVHGHCIYLLTGTFDLLGEADAQGAALARVREALR